MTPLSFQGLQHSPNSRGSPFSGGGPLSHPGVPGPFPPAEGNLVPSQSSTLPHTPGLHIPASSSSQSAASTQGSTSASQTSVASQQLLHSSSSTMQNSASSGDLTDSLLPKDLHQAMSDQELTALLTQQDIATSLAEDLLAQFAQSNQAGESSGPAKSESMNSSQVALAEGGLARGAALDSSKKGNILHSSDSKSSMDLKLKGKWDKDLGVDLGESSAAPKPSLNSVSSNMTAIQIANLCKGHGEC